MTIEIIILKVMLFVVAAVMAFVGTRAFMTPLGLRITRRLTLYGLSAYMAGLAAILISAAAIWFAIWGHPRRRVVSVGYDPPEAHAGDHRGLELTVVLSVEG